MRTLGVAVCLATVLPLFRGRKWWFRVFDFPRLQVSALGAAVLIAHQFRKRPLSPTDRWLRNAVGAAVGLQLLQIYRYTPLAPKQVLRAGRRQRSSTLSILTSNVLMHNRQVQPLLDLIHTRQPDLILLLEPDPWWESRVASLQDSYPYTVRAPLDNTYGLLFYSRLELINPELRFLVQPDIPSVRTQIRLRNGNTVWFYGVHPRPPGRINPKGEIRGTAPRDAELIRVAKEVQHLRGPVIVAGDFNDVAWSHTTRLFQRLSGLLDPRVGRGLYNTFHAEHRIFRFPLDHLFHSEHFALGRFERLGYVGSDHFPIYAELILAPEAPAVQEAPTPDSGDHEEAQELMQFSGQE